MSDQFLPHFKHHLISQGRAERTLNAYESDLRQFVAWFELFNERPFTLKELTAIDVREYRRLMTPTGRLYFWRTRSGVEVDFVVEHGRRLLAIEVKRTAQPSYGDTAGLRAFLVDHPKAAGGLLLHSGREIRRLDKNIVAMPWTVLTG